MDEKTCGLHREKIEGNIKVNTERLNNHSDRLDNIEKDIVAQKKDTTHLQDAIKSLQNSIDKLIEVVDGLKSKPLEKYEKIGMVIITAVVGYVIGKVL